MGRTPRSSKQGRALEILAGPLALARIRAHGLRPEDVDVVPGASGGPKWLVLSRLDRAVFGEFFKRPRERPLHLIGSSIGSWRLAMFARKDPTAALTRFEEIYLKQRYPPKAPPDLVADTNARMLEQILGPTGAKEIVDHPWARLHVIVTHCRGLAASERKALLLGGMAVAALGNLASRRSLAWQMRRVVFHTAGDTSPFRGLADLPTLHAPLTAENLHLALQASGAVPLVLSGVPIPGGPARGIYRDGGVIDYHPDVPFGSGDGVVLYPHFYPRMTPGWFDKSLWWRRAGAKNFSRALILAPSAAFVARLPGGKIPDRQDFYKLSDTERMEAWSQTCKLGEQLADEFREWLALDPEAAAARVRPLDWDARSNADAQGDSGPA